MPSWSWLRMASQWSELCIPAFQLTLLLTPRPHIWTSRRHIAARGAPRNTGPAGMRGHDQPDFQCAQVAGEKVGHPILASMAANADCEQRRCVLAADNSGYLSRSVACAPTLWPGAGQRATNPPSRPRAPLNVRRVCHTRSSKPACVAFRPVRNSLSFAAATMAIVVVTASADGCETPGGAGADCAASVVPQLVSATSNTRQCMLPCAALVFFTYISGYLAGYAALLLAARSQRWSLPACCQLCQAHGSASPGLLRTGMPNARWA